jgi:hypothetical protein
MQPVRTVLRVWPGTSFALRIGPGHRRLPGSHMPTSSWETSSFTDPWTVWGPKYRDVYKPVIFLVPIDFCIPCLLCTDTILPVFWIQQIRYFSSCTVKVNCLGGVCSACVHLRHLSHVLGAVRGPVLWFFPSKACILCILFCILYILL